MLFHKQDNKDHFLNYLEYRQWFGTIIIIIIPGLKLICATSGAWYRSYNYMLTILSLFLDTAMMSWFIPLRLWVADLHFNGYIRWSRILPRTGGVLCLCEIAQLLCLVAC